VEIQESRWILISPASVSVLSTKLSGSTNELQIDF
jgi:hypothetical protein